MAPPTARPAAPAPPPVEDELASTIVFAKQKPKGLPTTPPAVVIPAPPTPKPQPVDAPAETVVIKAQPVVIPSAATVKPAAAPAPAPMNVPPPMPAGAKFEAPRPAAPEPAVFREPSKPAEPPKPAAPAEPLPKGDGLRDDQWLYLLDGAQRGPIDVEDLIDLVLTSIPEDTKVWHPGLEGWVRANQLREIADEIPPPLPIPGAQRGYVDEDMPDFNTVPPMLRTVLIADEDAAFRKYLAMPLAAQGFTIYEAADGSAAWQLAVQNRPWMILADISMPEVDGFEFCRRVRNHPLLSRMPLLFISGSDKYKERYRALQIGADDFLSKNMPIRELLMRIQLLMTRYSDLSGGRAEAGDDRGRGRLPGPDRGLRRPRAPPDVQPGAPHRALHRARRGRREHRHGHGLPRGRHHLRHRGGHVGRRWRLRLPRLGEGQLQVHPGRPRRRASRSPRASSTSCSKAAGSSTSPARTRATGRDCSR